VLRRGKPAQVLLLVNLRRREERLQTRLAFPRFPTIASLLMISLGVDPNVPEQSTNQGKKKVCNVRSPIYIKSVPSRRTNDSDTRRANVKEVANPELYDWNLAITQNI
jgi:hypothetical protein